MEFLNIRKVDGLLYKAKAFKQHIEREYGSLSMKCVVIEAPAKNFKRGKTNTNTTTMLISMNALVSQICFDLWDVYPIYYDVTSARKIAWPDVAFHKIVGSDIKKEEVLRQVMLLEPQANWICGTQSGKLIKQNFDMADSYTIGRAFLIDDGKHNTKFL